MLGKKENAEKPVAAKPLEGTDLAAELEALAKRRGFFWPAAEIYGGSAGFYEYGPFGAAMKHKLENLWRRYFLNLGQNFFEIEANTIMPDRVFVASGHISNFNDPSAKCMKCGTVSRADHIIEDVIKESFEGVTPEELAKLIVKYKVKCPKCKSDRLNISTMSLMFPLNVGAEKGSVAYLRPETAQGVYVNFPRLWEVARKKLPLGAAIVGKAYRNEISPRQLLMRMREFTQAELQIFFDPAEVEDHPHWPDIANYKLLLWPATDNLKEPAEMTCETAVSELKLPKFYVWHMAMVQKWYLDVLKIPRNRFRFKELSPEERAFYNKLHWDMEIKLNSWDWKEMGGIHYRTDHDLGGHGKESKLDLSVFWNEHHVVPHVLELSFGVDRIFWALLDLGYHKDKRTVLKLPACIAPYQAAVFPLVARDGLDVKAEQMAEQLKGCMDVLYDAGDSIGRRYARADEIGIPFAITIDGQTLKDGTVTVRARDTTEQVRVNGKELPAWIVARL